MENIKKVDSFWGNKKPLALINTFGCQQNENDSEKIAGLLSEMGYGFTESPSNADLVIFNTCAIRENAEKKVYGMLGALKPLKEMRPSMVIALCGCMANEEHNVKRLKSTFRQVDIVFGTNSLHKFPTLLLGVLETRQKAFLTEEDAEIHEGVPTYRKSSLKVNVPIMYGCNNFCSYCIVPYVRGRERSRSEEDILNEVIAAKGNGAREVMLLGQNVNSFGGGGDRFASLLEKVSDTGIERIRFMTSHPKDIKDSVIRVMAERDNICKSLHLPLQAGSNAVLKAMNRKYTKEWFLEKAFAVKSAMPDITLTTDIIVGFPGETTEDFYETLDVLRKVQFDMIFSFIFSPRKGTPAEKMADVISDEEKKNNFQMLLDVQNEISLKKNQAMLGNIEKVLVEGESKTNSLVLTGRTEGNKIVNFEGDKSLIGSFCDVKITEVGTFNLTGETIKS